MPTMTSLEEETPGRRCECCLADVSFLPEDFHFCPACGWDLRDVEEDEVEDGDIEGTEYLGEEEE